MRAWIAMLGLVLACESGGGTGATTSGSGSTKAAQGSAKGFGADLLRELETGSDKPAAGSAAAKPAAGSADTKIATGSAAKPVETKPVETKPADTKPADTKPAETKPAETKPADTKPADTKPADTKVAGSAAKPADTKVATGSAAKPADTKPADTKVATGSAAKPADTKPADTKVATGSAAKPADSRPADARPPVAVSAELKQIKLALLPNWERDVDEAGTISLSVKVPGRTQATVFRFRYGFEDSKAPADRDAYKKWLADNKVLVPRQDRQAGAAWFIEGTDGSGSPAFRIVVNYGGRKLICGGSLYKDNESNKLGDLRDQTIIQAKQICESVAL